MNLPKIGLVLSTLNAMPHLKDAFEAIKKTKYKNLKIIVQDGKSNDDTLNYLSKQSKYFDIDIVSSSDKGVGEAYSKALKRMEGCDYVSIISADEMIKSNFFEIHLELFKKNPYALAIYGSVILINPKKGTETIFKPGSFSLKKILSCETIPPISTCMFNSRLLGEDLHYYENIKTAMDYEFWVRLALKYPKDRFIKTSEVLSINRMDEISMSFKSNSYLQAARDKVLGLKMNFKTPNGKKNLSKSEINKICLDIYCWAAEMVFSLKGANQEFVDILIEATENCGESKKLLQLINKSDDLKNYLKGSKKHALIIEDEKLKIKEITNSSIINLSLGSTMKDYGCKERLISKNKIKFISGHYIWGYVWLINLKSFISTDRYPVGLKFNFNLKRGQMSVGILNNNEIDKEIGFSHKEKICNPIDLKIRESNKNPILFVRNFGKADGICMLSNLVYYSSSFRSNKLLNSNIIDLKEVLVCAKNGASQHLNPIQNSIKYIGGTDKWGYICLYNFNSFLSNNSLKRLEGVTCYFSLKKGKISICILNNNEIDNEILFNEKTNDNKVTVRIDESNKNPLLCFRNGGSTKSIFTLLKVVLHTSIVS